MIPKAINRVIVNKSHSLYESVDSSRADKIEAALLEIPTDLLRQIGLRRLFRHRLPLVLDGLPVRELQIDGSKLPDSCACCLTSLGVVRSIQRQFNRLRASPLYRV